MVSPIATKSDSFIGPVCHISRDEVLPRCSRAASEEDLRGRDTTFLEARRVLELELPLAIEALGGDIKALVDRIKTLTKEHPEKERIYALQDRIHRALGRDNGLNTEAVGRQIMDCTYSLDHIGIPYGEAIKKEEALEAMGNLLALCQKEERAPFFSVDTARVQELEERLEITLLKKSAIEQLFSHPGIVSLDPSMRRALSVVLAESKVFEERLHQRLDLLS
ncbi:MAG: hypothetical protein JSR76_03430 [Verrucomicrobia bacterium]|nr:hypothetical protein [Verrucomicrobiota bacterium]